MRRSERLATSVEGRNNPSTDDRSASFWIIKLFEGLSILLRGGLEGLPLILMEFLRV